MNQKISVEQAQEMLQTAEQTADQTRKAVASSEGGMILMMWGIITAVCFMGTELFIRRGWSTNWGIGALWSSVCSLGCFITWLVSRWQYRTGRPARPAAEKKIGQRVFWFWMLLYLFIGVWIAILQPRNGIQINAFVITAIMFAYVVSGLWTDGLYMLWLGLAVTALTLIGYFVIPHQYYNLWMTPAVGGSMFGTGLYVYLRGRLSK